MPDIRKFMGLIAGGIIFLHAIVPHRHLEEMAWEEHAAIHANARSLVDYLNLTFHHGFQDNLENYLVTDQPSDGHIITLTLAGTIWLPIPASYVSDLISPQNTDPFVWVKNFHVRLNGLRAPPIHEYNI
jgi:hypothetical protein